MPARSMRWSSSTPARRGRSRRTTWRSTSARRGCSSSGTARPRTWRSTSAGWRAAWDAVLAPMLPRQAPGVTVLRDYHAENIMLLQGGEQGLIDFQDALVGHPAYDLVSLLQDARARRLARTRAADARPLPGASRCRVPSSRPTTPASGRSGTPRSSASSRGCGSATASRATSGMIPRVWQAMERDLAHPALAPVAEWFAANVPQDLRDSGGGEIR